jgi:esterase/lipase superfamily enzyme
MHREYVKWFSGELRREMELLLFGESGVPLLVFPTSCGRFYDYENRGMIEPLRAKIESGQIHAVCVDSVDAESWYNKAIHPRERVQRHIEYERYILAEVLPWMRHRSGAGGLVVTGCSFGGYHSVNFTLRHPQEVAKCVSMGGAFDIHQFMNGYSDDNVYFNCPPDFLPNLNDERYLGNYRRRTRIILATGERDICLEENLRLSKIMNSKSIPHLLDVWGEGTGHDWPWWQQMAVKFL